MIANSGPAAINLVGDLDALTRPHQRAGIDSVRASLG
jgi:hypothetical protein